MSGRKRSTSERCWKSRYRGRARGLLWRWALVSKVASQASTITCALGCITVLRQVAGLLAATTNITGRSCGLLGSLTLEACRRYWSEGVLCRWGIGELTTSLLRGFTTSGCGKDFCLCGVVHMSELVLQVCSKPIPKKKRPVSWVNYQLGGISCESGKLRIILIHSLGSHAQTQEPVSKLDNGCVRKAMAIKKPLKTDYSIGRRSWYSSVSHQCSVTAVRWSLAMLTQLATGTRAATKLSTVLLRNSSLSTGTLTR